MQAQQGFRTLGYELERDYVLERLGISHRLAQELMQVSACCRNILRCSRPLQKAVSAAARYGCCCGKRSPKPGLMSPQT